ncbi:MAG: 2-dehydropantoate 2-reductase [SAR324 cluster bacterium]|nr:2-dehydropantoate 2-reductase [SAR324 cluster bacterium]
MRIAIMGSGGLGGYYGGRLAAAGEDVTFIARGANLEALRETGLRVESKLGDIFLPKVDATDDTAAVGAVDLVIVTTKAYGLDAAVQAMRPLVGPATTVLPLLNGVDSAERMGAVLGMQHVVGGSCMVSSTLVGPGHVRHNTPGERLVFGELFGEITPRCQAIEAAFKQAKINGVLSPQILVELWSKFVFYAAIAGSACVARGSSDTLSGDPDQRWMFLEAMREIERVARARGVGLGTTVVDDWMKQLSNMPPGTKPSMLVDLEQGRPLELDATTGALVRMAAEAGLEVPVNRTMYTALKRYEHGAQ